MRQADEAIVVGAGHNGLVAACLLAKAGLRVTVVEQSDRVGGAAVSRSMEPGWTYSSCSYVCSLLRPEIVRALDLPRHGLQVIPYENGATFTANGGYFAYFGEGQALRREMARFSAKDADAYERYHHAVMRQCRFIRPLLMRTPPDPVSPGPRDLGELMFLLRRFNDLGARDMAEALRFWTMSIGDFLNEFFETDLIKAHFAGSGIIGTGLGVYSPGSAYVLLHHYMGDVDGSIGAWGFARGGMGSVTQALASALAEAGGAIRLDAPVERFLIESGRAAGIVLGNGEELRAGTIISNLDLKRTFLELTRPDDLPDEFIQSVRRFKIRGSSAKLNVALDGMPSFPAAPADAPFLSGDLHASTSLLELERAYDDWKNGEWSAEPYFDLLIPSRTDPTLAPPGKHMATIFVQYAPYRLAGGRSWDDAARDALADTVLRKIATISPDFSDLIVHKQVRTPLDLENEVGLTEGNIFHGELTFDQLLFNRPLPGFANYRTPITGLYLCGSSTHPGGGVMGAPGWNAAREVIRDLRKPVWRPRLKAAA